MIVRAVTISFGIDRSPMPSRVRIGYEGDHMVERLEFILPVIAENQTGFLMVSGDHANVIRLADNADTGRYYVDLTASMIGSDGKVDCYIRIDGSGGKTWQSGILKMIVGDVPDVEIEVEREYPTAVSQMLGAMAEHDAAMERYTETVQELADAAAVSASDAAQSAAYAQESANNAQNALSVAQAAATAAAQSSTNAAESADAAAASAEASTLSAGRAEQAAAMQGYIFFEINDAGRLIMTRTENVTDVDFRLMNGRLEAMYG